MINQVAFVSETANVTPAQMSLVSAAVQKQIARDVAPSWQIQATVDSFSKLEDVPVGYWHIVIRDDVPDDVAGIHKNGDNGQPFALVRFADNWSLAASHEAIEMLIDPSGDRTVTSNSVKPGQGRAQYLVEVCDPCQSAAFAYTVNGVLVSDFYTPRYFDPVTSSGVQYSFTGSLKSPRQVAEGGYLSWFDPRSRHLFQMFVNGGRKSFEDRGSLPQGFTNLRALSDSLTAQHRQAALVGQPSKKVLLTSALAGSKDSSVDESCHAQASSLRSQIDRLLKGGRHEATGR